MLTRAQKWGNSLAVRLPRAYAEQLGLKPDSEVEITLTDTGLCITPLRKPRYALDELLAGVTPDNIHGETDWGLAAGDEEW
jgi:antitoxin MazE